MNATMDGLADVRKAKVKEAYEKATVKCKAGSGSAAKPPARAPPAAKPPPAPKAQASEALALDIAPPKKPLAKPPGRLMVGRLFWL